MKQLICRTCGSPLQIKADHYKCRYCDSIYIEEEAAKFQEELESALESYKIESLAKAKKTLYDATHRRFPSQSAVSASATAVLAISPNDFLAKVYLHSYDGDPCELVSILAGAKVSAAEAQEAFTWLLPNLHPRSIGAIKSFLERNLSDKTLTKSLNELEKEAEKADEGIYDASFPRDVFLCYSSSDMPSVVSTMELLEENGIMCFAAFRNLRTGRGAAERYNDEIHKAMKACKCLVFLSSTASRSPSCDAVRIELPYLLSDLPEKPRCEFLLEDYSKQKVPLLAMRVLKDAFDGLQWVRGEEELIDRILSFTSRGQTYRSKKEEPPAPESPSDDPAQYEYSCPSCGEGVPYLAKFCPNCGTSLNWGAQNSQTQEEPPAEEPAETGYSCPNCGAGVTYLAPSCPSCGTTFNWGNTGSQDQEYEEEYEEPDDSNAAWTNFNNAFSNSFFGGQQSQNKGRSKGNRSKGSNSQGGGLSLTVSSTSGNIVVQNGSSFSVVGGSYSQHGQNIIASTISDDITVYLPAGAYGKLILSNTSGNINILADQSSFTDIQASNTSGDIYLAVPSFNHFRGSTISGDLTTRKQYPNVSFTTTSGSQYYEED